MCDAKLWFGSLCFGLQLWVLSTNLGWIKKPLLNKLWFCMISNASISCLEHRKAATFTKPLLSLLPLPQQVRSYCSSSVTWRRRGEGLEGGSKYSLSNYILTELVSICASWLFKRRQQILLALKFDRKLTSRSLLGIPRQCKTAVASSSFPSLQYLSTTIRSEICLGGNKHPWIQWS